MIGNLFSSEGIRVGIVDGQAIFDLSGKKALVTGAALVRSELSG